MSEAVPWEAFLEAHFMGYLLPRSHRLALSEEAAARFLERLGGEPSRLYLVRAASALSPHAAALRQLALRDIPILARDLSPRAELEPSSGERPLEGRIDVTATLKRRLEGRASHVVTRPRRPRFCRPEDALLKAVSARLAGVLSDLRLSGVLASAGWGEGLDACEDALRRALSTTALRNVIDEPITSRHEQAALAASQPAYAIAAILHRALHDAIDAPDPEATSLAVAEGALLPLDPPARFEIAVLLRLMQAIERRLDEAHPGRWALLRTAIVPDRSDIACFERDDGATVRLFYNQSCLATGAHDLGARRYLGQRGRLRPDITIAIRDPSATLERAVVVECKLSSDPEYLAQGYRQALLYRHEYAQDLKGWPKAVLVASSSLPGEPRHEDDVIAIGWDRWVPDLVLEGLLDGLAVHPPKARSLFEIGRVRRGSREGR